MLVSRIKPCMSKFNRFSLEDCGRLIISVMVYLMVDYYKDNRGNSRANTCTTRASCSAFIRLQADMLF